MGAEAGDALPRPSSEPQNLLALYHSALAEARLRAVPMTMFAETFISEKIHYRRYIISRKPDGDFLVHIVTEDSMSEVDLSARAAELFLRAARDDLPSAGSLYDALEDAIYFASQDANNMFEP